MPPPPLAAWARVSGSLFPSRPSDPPGSGARTAAAAADVASSASALAAICLGLVIWRPLGSSPGQQLPSSSPDETSAGTSLEGASRGCVAEGSSAMEGPSSEPEGSERPPPRISPKATLHLVTISSRHMWASVSVVMTVGKLRCTLAGGGGWGHALESSRMHASGSAVLLRHR